MNLVCDAQFKTRNAMIWLAGRRTLEHRSDKSNDQKSSSQPILMCLRLTTMPFVQHRPTERGSGLGLLQECLASVEQGATQSLTFASGLAATHAITAMISAQAKESGDATAKLHALVCDDVYGGTFRLFSKCTTVHARNRGLETQACVCARKLSNAQQWAKRYYMRRMQVCVNHIRVAGQCVKFDFAGCGATKQGSVGAWKL